MYTNGEGPYLFKTGIASLENSGASLWVTQTLMAAVYEGSVYETTNLLLKRNMRQSTDRNTRRRPLSQWASARQDAQAGKGALAGTDSGESAGAAVLRRDNVGKLSRLPAPSE
jgi:hypothetical protein